MTASPTPITNRTSVSPKADLRAATASPLAVAATNSVAAEDDRSAPARVRASSLEKLAASSGAASLSVEVPAGKRLALCRVERDDKNQIVLRTMAPISTAANSGAFEADDMSANVLDGVQTRNENKTGSKA